MFAFLFLELFYIVKYIEYKHYFNRNKLKIKASRIMNKYSENTHHKTKHNFFNHLINNNSKNIMNFITSYN